MTMKIYGWEGGGAKPNTFKNSIYPFYRPLNFTSFGISPYRFTSQVYILRTFKHLPILSKTYWHDVTKMSFPQKILDGLTESSMKHVKMTPDKALKVLRRCLPSFSSYRKIRWRNRSARRVKLHGSLDKTCSCLKPTNWPFPPARIRAFRHRTASKV